MSQAVVQYSPNLAVPSLKEMVTDSVLSQDFFKLKAIISKNRNYVRNFVNDLDNDGYSLLHRACLSGCNDIALELINIGASPNSKGKGGTTPLFSAIKSKKTQIVETLLYEGADPNITNEIDGSPLHFAIWEENYLAVELLLEYEADFNKKFRGDVTPLHTAVLRGSASIVKLLSRAGADIFAKDITSPSIRQLVKHVFPTRETYIVEALNNAEANIDQGSPLIHLAVLFAIIGNPSDVVSTLLDIDPEKNPNLKDFSGNTPLYYAAINSKHDLVNILRFAGAEEF